MSEPFDIETHVRRLTDDGYTVIEDFADAAALAAARAALAAPHTLPSARVLSAMRAEHADSFSAFVSARSLDTRARLLALPYSADLKARFDQLAAASVAEQKRIEASDQVPFEDYRREYTSPERLGTGARAVLAGAESV